MPFGIPSCTDSRLGHVTSLTNGTIVNMTQQKLKSTSALRLAFLLFLEVSCHVKKPRLACLREIQAQYPLPPQPRAYQSRHWTRPIWIIQPPANSPGNRWCENESSRDQQNWQTRGTTQLLSFRVVCYAKKANKRYTVQGKNYFQYNIYITSSTGFNLRLVKCCNSST